MKMLLIALVFTGCVANYEPEPVQQEPRGACAYTWDLGGTWVTWCYQNDTSAACNARASTVVWFKGFGCPESGYPLRCNSGAYKNSACQWYE